MSRDEQVRKEWEDDPLCHDTGTLEGLADMLDRAAQLTALGEGRTVKGLSKRLPCPLWQGHGSKDGVVSYEASKMVFDVLEVEGGDKTFRTYEGAYHKLHAEPEGIGETFAREVAEWVLKHVDGEPRDDDVKAKL